MFNIDIYTIYLIIGINNLIFAAIMFHLHLITDKKVNGVYLWAVGSVITGIGFIITAFFQGNFSIVKEFLFSISLNMCILSGDIIFLNGLLKFKNKPINKYLWIIPVLSAANIIFFTLIYHQMNTRSIINGILIISIYIITAIEFLKPFQKEFRSLFYTAGIVFLIYVLISLIRILYQIFYPIKVPVADYPITRILILTAGLSMILFTYIMIVVVNQHLINMLNQQIQSRNKLYSIISHDLRGSIGTLFGFVDVLKQKINFWDKEQTTKWINQMENISLGAGYILENLLGWSKSQLNEIKANPETNEINTLILKVLKQIKGLAESKHITITFNQNSPVYAFFDLEMITIVLRNIINNAIKFTNQNGKIDIYITENEKDVEIKIQDNGIGMTLDKINSIFKDQIQSTYGTAQEKGSGFGLLLCRDFIMLNNGNFIIKSVENVGSVFTVQLPKFCV
ncbi:MAG: HAMP domain-containing histidine kinase [Bacteroidales bacterium]|nr:HAMP domain-containing histidine kinase [Bacteroidales bacterium]